MKQFIMNEAKMSLRIAKFNHREDTENKYYKEQVDKAQKNLDRLLYSRLTLWGKIKYFLTFKF